MIWRSIWRIESTGLLTELALAIVAGFDWQFWASILFTRGVDVDRIL